MRLLKLIGAWGILAVMALAFGLSFARAEINTDSAVQVCVKGDKCQGHGSGVYIGDGYVLTAAHVAEHMGEDGTVKVERPRGGGDEWVDSWTADVMWIDKRQDFALLKIKAVDVALPASQVSCEKLKMQQAVTIVGWPLNLGRIQSTGYVAGDEAPRKPLWAHAYIVVAPITFGNSGGPVYGDNGKVVGLAVGIVDGTSLSLVIPTYRVCAQLPSSIKPSAILDELKTRLDEEKSRK